METNRICPSCQKTLPPNVPLGLCPECLIKSGFNTGTDPGNPGKQSGFVPPPVEELRKLFPQLEIIELIGKGGMGAVYKARQMALDRLVALKILPPGAADDAGFAERFNREARALARLNHPHIVAVHDFGVAAGILPAVEPGVPPGGKCVPGPKREESSEDRPGGTMPPSTAGGTPAATALLHYLLMEFVDGPNLRQVEQAGRLTPEQALEIVPQICEALQFAHNEGVVHRDIKPENILLDKKGRVKITDFGIAKIVGVPAGKISLTGAKDVLGTPHYMAPEQVEKPSTVDHRADIYSLGVVFYELLTGELPLGKFQPPSKKVQVDVRLDEVVLHALEKEPALRYQQASQVKTDVETIAATASSGSSPARRDQCAPSEDQSRLTSAATIHSVVKAPANWLVATGILNWIAIPLVVFVTAGILAGKGTLLAAPMLLVPLLAMIFSSVMIVAGLKIKRLEAYPLAIIGSILAMLVTPGNIIGLPVGIWSLVVLCRREVREAFGRKLPLASLASGAAAAPVPRPDRFWRRFAVAIALVLLALVLIPAGLIVLSIALPALSRAKVKMQQPSEASDVSMTFGPVRQVTLNDLDESNGNEALNFANGQLASLPGDFEQRTTEARVIWLNSNRVDLLVDFARARWALLTRSLKFRDLPSEKWNAPHVEFGGQWPDSEVLEKREHRGDAFYLLPTNAQPPLTFAFQTSAGVHGVLQITGFNERPRGMRLRYKLAQLPGGGGGGGGVGRATATPPDLVDSDAEAIKLNIPNRYLAAALAGMDLAAKKIKDAAARGELSEQADVFNHFNELCDQLQGKNQNAATTPKDWGIQNTDKFKTITDSLAALEDASERMRDIARSTRHAEAEREALLKEEANKFVSSYADFKAQLHLATQSGGMGAAGQDAQRKFVRLVVDKTALTFEGQSTSWDGVGALLAKVPDRKNTVLEFAVTSDQITVAQQNEWFQKATALARQHGFEYASFIGIHPLGSKGASLLQPSQPTTRAKPGEFRLTLTNGVAFEVVAVTRNPRNAGDWWKPGGEPFVKPPVEIVRILESTPNYQPENEFLVYVRSFPPANAGRWQTRSEFQPHPARQRTAMIRENSGGERAATIIEFQQPPESVNLQVMAATGPWEAVAEFDGRQTRELISGITVTCGPARFDERHQSYQFEVMHNVDRGAYALRMVARLRNGRQHEVDLHGGVTSGTPAKGYTIMWPGDFKPEDVTEYVLERTPWVRGEIRNISLAARKPFALQ